MGPVESVECRQVLTIGRVPGDRYVARRLFVYLISGVEIPVLQIQCVCHTDDLAWLHAAAAFDVVKGKVLFGNGHASSSRWSYVDGHRTMLDRIGGIQRFEPGFTKEQERAIPQQIYDIRESYKNWMRYSI